MSDQELAMKMLELLKGTGISFRSFASRIGINIDSLYSYRSCPSRLSKEKAKYIIAQIEINYPNEWEYIIQQMKFMVQ